MYQHLYISTALYTTTAAYTKIPNCEQLSSPPEFRRKTEKSKKDNNSIFGTEKVIFLMSFQCTFLYN